MLQLRLILWGAIAVAVIAAGLYARHIYVEARRVPELVQQIKTLERHRQEDRDAAAKALAQEADIRKRLEVADRRAADLARRLRDYYSRLPKSPAPAADPERTGGSGSGPREITDDLGSAIAACQRDAIRLNAWIEWYRRIPPELK